MSDLHLQKHSCEIHKSHTGVDQMARMLCQKYCRQWTLLNMILV